MFKDYVNMVLKPNMKWLKMHWKGYFILLIIFGSIGYVIERLSINKSIHKQVCTFNKSLSKDNIQFHTNKEFKEENEPINDVEES